MFNKELEIAKEVENIKLNTDINISTEDMAKLVSGQYKKAQSLATKQGKEQDKTTNDIIPPETDIDNGEIDLQQNNRENIKRFIKIERI